MLMFGHSAIGTCWFQSAPDREVGRCRVLSRNILLLVTVSIRARP